MNNFSLVMLLGIPLNVLYESLVATFALVVLALFFKRSRDEKKIILWILLIEYAFIVLSSTVIFRRELTNSKVVAMPFWIYIEVFKGNPAVTPLDIFYNFLLLFPMGLLLAGIFPNIKWDRVFLIGLAFSLGIEILQYVFQKGVSQLDDLAHNSIGCVVGWYVGKILFVQRKRQ